MSNKKIKLAKDGIVALLGQFCCYTQIPGSLWFLAKNKAADAKRDFYGTGLLASLSRDLTLRLGKGFSRSYVVRIRQFYLAHLKGTMLSHFLSWSHIKNTYLKQVQAPVGVKTDLTCWMELN